MAKTKADRIMEMAANVALSEIGAGPEITGFSDRDEARAALAALVDEAANAPADPALLALAKLGAWLCRHYWLDVAHGAGGFGNSDAGLTDRAAGWFGVMDESYTPRPGIADAVARLLAPDGAASEGVTG